MRTDMISPLYVHFMHFVQVTDSSLSGNIDLRYFYTDDKTL